MARTEDREKALVLRKKGKSYSQIKNSLGISKSTLHYWLKDLPLSEERIRQLRDTNPRRIEKFRNTMRIKKEKRLNEIYKKVSEDIGKLSKREFFVSGLFLYWAEGTKTGSYSTAISNTDPAVIKFFILWMKILGVPKEKLKVKLHLYSDMNIDTYSKWWSKKLGIPLGQFLKPYVKITLHSKRINYRGRFGHGTCNILFGSRNTKEYIIMGLKRLQELFD